MTVAIMRQSPMKDWGRLQRRVVEIKPGVSLAEAEVIEFWRPNLAHFKRPRRIFFDKVPRNPTGKIEKPKLREKYKNTLIVLNTNIETLNLNKLKNVIIKIRI